MKLPRPIDADALRRTYPDRTGDGYQDDTDKLAGYLTDYVRTHLTASKNNMYVCPYCGSGTGKNGTGAFSVIPENPKRFKCFACGKTGDLFDLISKIDGITDFQDQKQRARELYSPATAYTRKTETKRPEPAAAQQPAPEKRPAADVMKELQERRAYFEKCNNRLNQTQYHRGISLETLNAFTVGYEPAWKNPKAPNGPASPRLIIPTGGGSYIARSTNPAEKEYRVFDVGDKQLFNVEALTTATKPIFIVEGEIDALSIIDAGGEAVGLGGTGGINKLTTRLQSQRPGQPLIIALDNDDAGKKATAELTAELNALKIDYRVMNVYGDQKDANDALNADRGALESKIKNVLDLARIEYINSRSIYGFMPTYFDHIRKGYTPIPTGFSKFDRYALDGGFIPGLIFLGAISSLGKTSFILQAADNMARAGHDVLYFSLEMSKVELISKSLSRLTYVNCLARDGSNRYAKKTSDLLRGTSYFNETEIGIVKEAIDEYEKSAPHMFIFEGNDGEKDKDGNLKPLDVNGIYKRVEKHYEVTGQRPVVFVDYLQILPPLDPRAVERAAINANVKRLKDLSRDFDIPVIVISSFNRQNYHTDVEMEAFKESGGIEYSGDLVLGMQLHGQEKEAQNTATREKFNQKREKRKDPRDIEIQVLKNRNGSISKSGMFKFYSAYNFFMETEFED